MNPKMGIMSEEKDFLRKHYLLIRNVCIRFLTIFIYFVPFNNKTDLVEKVKM